MIIEIIKALAVFGLGWFAGFMYPPHRIAMYEKQNKEKNKK